jgi:hypothetical protein
MGSIMQMTDLEKLRVLLPHWINHNGEHGKEFLQWAELCEDSGHIQVAEALRKAIEAIEQVNRDLGHALDLAGGPIEGPYHHHHHEQKKDQ